MVEDLSASRGLEVVVIEHGQRLDAELVVALVKRVRVVLNHHLAPNVRLLLNQVLLHRVVYKYGVEPLSALKRLPSTQVIIHAQPVLIQANQSWPEKAALGV